MRDRGPRRVAAALCGLSIALAGGAARAERPRIGVVVTTHVNLLASQADALALRLAQALRGRLDVDVTAGAETRRRLPAGGVADDCAARPDCVRDVAARLRRDELLFVSIVRIGARYRVDVTWADARAGSVSSRPALIVDDAAGAGDMDRVFAGAARDILPGAPPRIAGAGEVRERPAPPVERAGPAPVDEPPVERGPADMASGADTASGADDAAAAMPVPGSSDLGHRRGRRFTAPVIVAGVVTAAALATGVGFAVAARHDYDALESDGCDSGPCPDADARVDKMERRALVADVMFAASGAAALTALILYLTSADDVPETRVQFGATTTGAAVVSVGRSF